MTVSGQFWIRSINFGFDRFLLFFQLQGHFGVILRDLNSFWVIFKSGHIRSFQGRRGNFKKHCVKNCILRTSCSLWFGSGSESQFWGLSRCVEDWWFRKMDGRHRAIQEKTFKIVLSRLRSFLVVQVILGHFRSLQITLSHFRLLQH